MFIFKGHGILFHINSCVFIFSSTVFFSLSLSSFYH
jgi:hypothetical protein